MTQGAIFYCPMKPADASQPSGVPRIGHLFVRAMRGAGFAVEMPDFPLTYDGQGNPTKQHQLRDAAIQAAQRYLADVKAKAQKPQLWLTYHSYYKSPDLIGPIVADKIGCRYLIAEGSFARKRATGPWADHHEAARVALARADCLLAATERDREGLEIAARSLDAVSGFPPFIDCKEFKPRRVDRDAARIRILAAGSMRDERKRQSYTRLFAGVARLPANTYSLIVAGDGPMRQDIEARARTYGVDAHFAGQLRPFDMPKFFAQGDLFAWPGVGEAYGLTYLEAQAAGVPIVAENHGGVSACVRNGVSGILTEPSDPDDFARALRRLMEDAELRFKLSNSAHEWVNAERSLEAASARLSKLIDGSAP